MGSFLAVDGPRRLYFTGSFYAGEGQIETSFYEAIRIVKEQKSVSLEKRAEGSYAEYHRQKTSGSGGHGFMGSDYLFGDSSQRAVSRFVGSPAFIKQTLEMQSEYTSATRDPLKEACLARGVGMHS